MSGERILTGQSWNCARHWLRSTASRKNVRFTRQQSRPARNASMQIVKDVRILVQCDKIVSHVTFLCNIVQTIRDIVRISKSDGFELNRLLGVGVQKNPAQSTWHSLGAFSFASYRAVCKTPAVDFALGMVQGHCQILILQGGSNRRSPMVFASLPFL